jgi:DNA-binding PadR family transcriptional regulator
VSGFRNRDLQAHLHTSSAPSREEARRRSGRVSRLLRLLRAHGLIRKLPKTHRYKLSDKGRQVATAILAAHGLSLEQINRAVA